MGQADPMNMSAKNEYMRERLPHYLKANKHEKTNLLNHICQTTGYQRKYAVAKLSDMQKKPPAEKEGRVRKKRTRKYGGDCLPPLKKIWEFLEWPCGERLQPYLPTIIPVLEMCAGLKMPPSVRSKLLEISISTVDRLLAKERRVRRGQGISTTKAGALLKSQIPVRHEPWPEDTHPGYAEMDFVAHCGEVNAGDYVATLSTIDIATTWIEHVPVLGRSKRKTVDALDEIRNRLPFPLRGLDPDNDGQFVNYFLYDWCQEQEPVIELTRSRPYRKNDNAHIEQKNWSHVRRVFGYQRLDTAEQWQLMRKLYRGPLRDWQNFFQPTLKIKAKERRGARVIKRHDQAKTPYQRVLDNPQVSKRRKRKLRDYYATLNPVIVKKEVANLIKQIFKS